MILFIAISKWTVQNIVSWDRATVGRGRKQVDLLPDVNPLMKQIKTYNMLYLRKYIDEQCTIRSLTTSP